MNCFLDRSDCNRASFKNNNCSFDSFSNLFLFSSPKELLSSLEISMSLLAQAFDRIWIYYRNTVIRSYMLMLLVLFLLWFSFFDYFIYIKNNLINIEISIYYIFKFFIIFYYSFLQSTGVYLDWDIINMVWNSDESSPARLIVLNIINLVNIWFALIVHSQLCIYEISNEWFKLIIY